MKKRYLYAFTLAAALVASLWAKPKTASTAEATEALGQTAKWKHCDVYETSVRVNDTEYHCTIVRKGSEARVTLESRRPTSASRTIHNKPVRFEGQTQKFVIVTLDDGETQVGPSTWTNDLETENGERYSNLAKTGPAPKEMLQPFAKLLSQLPLRLATAFKSIIESSKTVRTEHL
ncbi:MAG TPA: hypothetical protein VEZ90_15390 [Blastocatellia bacterium]|nr:hypothetical protein [Blastocatellia bacterium]